jgi:hypothetical protein
MLKTLVIVSLKMAVTGNWHKRRPADCHPHHAGVTVSQGDDIRERGGVVTSSALRASSPKGEDSALGVVCTKGLRNDIKCSVQRAFPLGEVGGVIRVDAVRRRCDRREGRSKVK